MDINTESDFKIGDRVIYKPIDYRDYSQNTSDRWYGETATIVDTHIFGDDDAFKNYYISFDKFPEVNHREHANRFYANIMELEAIRE